MKFEDTSLSQYYFENEILNNLIEFLAKLIGDSLDTGLSKSNVINNKQIKLRQNKKILAYYNFLSSLEFNIIWHVLRHMKHQTTSRI
ncbi:16457_t:CDS:2 [Cetraspora pellucida]|uniref:16457_t:CDS:1 n=1 Tax=Cetraspora pellucida TaxID=1433469 RepID=A0ACA9KPG3_9GLOM|nr:16457_t:CDS:2 [Cetraspora pellucida]